MHKQKQKKRVIKTADKKGRTCWYVVFGVRGVASITRDKRAIDGIRVDVMGSTVCSHYELITYLARKVKQFKKEVID